jgi:hypothetical protein
MIDLRLMRGPAGPSPQKAAPPAAQSWAGPAVSSAPSSNPPGRNRLDSLYKSLPSHARPTDTIRKHRFGSSNSTLARAAINCGHRRKTVETRRCQHPCGHPAKHAPLKRLWNCSQAGYRDTPASRCRATMNCIAPRSPTPPSSGLHGGTSQKCQVTRAAGTSSATPANMSGALPTGRAVELRREQATA